MGKISINGCGITSAKSPKVTDNTLHPNDFGDKKSIVAKYLSLYCKINALKQLAKGNIRRIGKAPKQPINGNTLLRMAQARTH